MFPLKTEKKRKTENDATFISTDTKTHNEIFHSQCITLRTRQLILAKNRKIVLFEVKSQDYCKIIYRNYLRYDKVSNCLFRNGSIMIQEEIK